MCAIQLFQRRINKNEMPDLSMVSLTNCRYIYSNKGNILGMALTTILENQSEDDQKRELKKYFEILKKYLAENNKSDILYYTHTAKRLSNIELQSIINHEYYLKKRNEILDRERKKRCKKPGYRPYRNTLLRKSL